MMSVRSCVFELNVPTPTVLKVLKKRLQLTCYKLHTLKPYDMLKRYDFACGIWNENKLDQTFINRILFSDEATFYTSELVYLRNVCI